MFSIHSSHLYDQDTFYKAFLHDLERANSLVVIESPFITSKRMNMIFPILSMLHAKGVRIVINTKPFIEHELSYRKQAMLVVGELQGLGVEVLITVGHHRKLAIIDNDILWEGSLNILSQNDSCEVMRRIKSNQTVKEMIRFTCLMKWCEN
jgi:phosphatidylserine/phosphatidylglycerophosphate/cardiolipin synthase-like enzyme